MTEARILFTGIGRRIELVQAFRQAALTLRRKLRIYGADLTGTAPALAYCDEIRSVVSMRDPEYIRNLLQICRADKISLLIPTIDTDLLILSENRERFEEIGTRVMISTPKMVRLCRDKNLTSRFFSDCGLNAPPPVSDWKRYAGGYPAFIKPKDGSSSVNAFKAENEKELEIYAQQIGEYVIQPFVSGREYTIDIFCDWDGEPISIVPRERLQVRAGEVLKTRIDMDEAMIQEATTLCHAFKPCGPITAQLIRDDAGKDWFIEINPRFGGGAPLSMKAGARTAEAVLKLLSGKRPAYFHDIENGTVYSRFDQSVCVLEGKSKISGIIFDLDDTLYSEKEYVRSGFRAVADYLGNPEYAQTLWNFFAAKTPAIDALLKEIGRESDRDAVLSAYRQHKPHIQPYEGVRELLSRFRRQGLKIGIITDGRPEGQRNKLEALGLSLLVDDIVITDELGGEQFRKPCDIAFRILQTRWRLPAETIVYVGDNPAKDFQAPRQLGMKCVYFKNPDGLYPSNLPGQIHTLSELPSAIKLKNNAKCVAVGCPTKPIKSNAPVKQNHLPGGGGSSL